MEKFKRNTANDAIAKEMELAKGLFKMAGINLDEEEKEEIEKPEDDGTVRGLLFCGDYTGVADFVMVQGFSHDENLWTVQGYEVYGIGYQHNLATASKGNDVFGNYKAAENFAKEIVTASRRKIKKKDIILCALEEGWNGDEINGIIFTEDKILSLSSSEPEYLISYAEIRDVDFDDENVIITVEDGEEATIHCDDEDSGYEYSKKIYNLIMDIRERLEESE